jgi:uncharacterized Zn ribbon protein
MENNTPKVVFHGRNDRCEDCKKKYWRTSEKRRLCKECNKNWLPERRRKWYAKNKGRLKAKRDAKKNEIQKQN